MFRNTNLITDNSLEYRLRIRQNKSITEILLQYHDLFQDNKNYFQIFLKTNSAFAIALLNAKRSQKHDYLLQYIFQT